MIENKYKTVLTNESVITANRKLLREAGCSDAQIQEFSRREFPALPKWLKVRLKAMGASASQSPKFKLKPQPGEYAFYVSVDRFPLQKTDEGKIMPLDRTVRKPIFTRPAGVPVNPAPIATEDIEPHKRGIQKPTTKEVMDFAKTVELRGLDYIK